MEKLTLLVHNHAEHAHWILFGCSILSGISIPISIDLLMILGAVLAATIVPNNLYLLFFSLFMGCILSAWLAYGVGRILGPKLLQFSFFRKLLSKKRIAKMQAFYNRRGGSAIFIGRFIPFGVRNALYYSCGMSKLSFGKFALWDTLGCGLWSLLSFSLYFILGKNIEVLYQQVKFVNFLICIAFSVTVIAFIWYKVRKKKAKEFNV